MCVFVARVGNLWRYGLSMDSRGLIFESPEAPRRAVGPKTERCELKMAKRTWLRLSFLSLLKVPPTEPSFRRSRPALFFPARRPRSRLESNLARSNRSVAPESSHRPQRGHVAHATDACGSPLSFCFVCCCQKTRARGAGARVAAVLVASVALVAL